MSIHASPGLVNHTSILVEPSLQFLDFAESNGLALLEVYAGQKRPVGNDWPMLASKDRGRWEVWLASGSNLGVHAGASDIATVDIEAARWEIATQWFRDELRMEIPDPHVSSARGGWHIFFRLPDSFKRLKLKFPWGDLIVGNSQTVAPPSCFDGKHYRFFSKTTKIYDGAVLLKLWPERTEREAAIPPALNGYSLEEVAWWIDRKAAGDWKDDPGALSQLDWVMLGKALKLHFPNEEGLDLFLRASHDADTAEKRWNNDHDFKPEWHEGARTLHWYLDRDITWMFREHLGCPVAPRPAPRPVVPGDPLPYGWHWEGDKTVRNGLRPLLADMPLAEHPHLTAPQAASLVKFWAHLPSGKIIHEPSRGLWASGSFDKHIGRIKDAMKTEGPGMLASTWASQHHYVDSMGWDPSKPMLIEDRILTDSGWIHATGCRSFNTYLPPDIEHVEGDVSKWLNHIRFIYSAEWQHIVHWFAHRVQRPGDKVNHGLVFIGDPGIGKDTAIEPVVAAIGPHNFKGITAASFFKSDFNGYLKSVMLRIDEVHDLGGESKYAFHDRTKTILAAPPMAHQINEKFVPHHSAVNVCGTILTSNHPDALYLPRDDRRHFVCISDRKKEDFPDGHFDNLYAWFENGGNEAIAHFLANLDLSAFSAKTPPPKTAGWHMIVAAGLAPESGDLADVIETLGNPAALTLPMIKARAPGGSQLRVSLDDVKLRKAIPKRLGEAGYVAVPNPDAASDGRWRVPDGKTMIYARRELREGERLAAARKLATPAPPPY
jgi:hypothetical protein